MLQGSESPEQTAAEAAVVRLGIMARADSRGLAWQTLEMVRHLDPDRVLCVLMDDPDWPEDPSRFDQWETHLVRSNLSANLNQRGLSEPACRAFLDGLDVVMAVETVYDWRFLDWARDMRVRTVIHGNPEFYAHHHHPDWPHPTEWVWPTDWMLDDLPGNHVLPVPVVEHDNVAAHPFAAADLRILHVAGKHAASDRNGTAEVIDSARWMKGNIHITIITQESRIPRRPITNGNVTAEVITGGVEDRWELYRNQHMLVLPRKYGGLCLPVLEAMSCGLAVMMTDTPPNGTWPGPRIKRRKGMTQRSPFGPIQCWTVDPMDIGQTVSRYAKDRQLLADAMWEARTWAEANTWTRLEPEYRAVLRGAL